MLGASHVSGGLPKGRASWRGTANVDWTSSLRKNEEPWEYNSFRHYTHILASFWKSGGTTLFKLSKLINGRFVWSIENLVMDAFADELARIMEEMTHDPSVSLRIERA